MHLPIWESYNYENIKTAKIGPSFIYLLSNRFSLQGDLMFLYSKQILHSPNTNPFSPISGQMQTDFKQTIYMINLPIKARYYLSKRWYAALGPSVDIQIETESSEYSRWFSGIGLIGELGYTITNLKNLYLEIAPELYMSNIISFDERPIEGNEHSVEMHFITLGIIGRYKF